MGGSENEVVIKRVGKAQEAANIEAMFMKVAGSSMKASTFKCYGYVKFILKANLPQGTDVGKVEGWEMMAMLVKAIVSGLSEVEGVKVSNWSMAKSISLDMDVFKIDPALAALF